MTPNKDALHDAINTLAMSAQPCNETMIAVRTLHNALQTQAELVEALRDLSFECFGVFHTVAPSIATYNRTFAIYNKHKTLARVEGKE